MITLGSTLCTVIKIHIIFFIIDLLCTPGMFLTWHGNRTSFVDCAANDAVIAFSSCNRAVVRIFSVPFSFLAPDMFIYFIWCKIILNIHKIRIKNCIKLQLFPLCLCSCILDHWWITAFKRSLVDFCDTCRNEYSFNIVIILKCACRNFSQALRQYDTFQAVTAVKSLFSYAGNTFGKFQFSFQTSTEPESSITYRCKAIWKIDLFQYGVIVKCLCSDLFDIFS